MMKRNMIISTVAAALGMLFCSCQEEEWKIPVGSDTVVYENSKVELVQTDGEWKLICNGKAMYVNGAATNNFYGDVAKFGGNCVRTYSAGVEDPKVPEILNEAYKNGLFVNVGIAIGAAKSFDYKDEAKVKAQFEKAQASVKKFMNHPAVLFWSVGNEAESAYNGEPELWKAINDIAKMIHETDPNHPVTTTLASASQDHINNIKSKCPELDFLCVNSYYPTVLETCDKVKSFGWEKPVMITEYGPRGTWAMNPEPDRILPWDGPTAGKGALIEETSTEKEARYLEIYENGIKPKTGNCIGSFAFVWGYQTHGEVLNWYGLFDKNGYSYGAVDALQYCWTGEYPSQRAPRIETRDDMTMNGLKAKDAITVAPNSDNTAKVVATSPSEVKLTYKWIIFKEGDTAEDKSIPDGMPGLIEDDTKAEIKFKAPSGAGAYRMYVFAKDDVNKKLASACIPFQVK